jgi:hypothetical protein
MKGSGRAWRVLALAAAVCLMGLSMAATAQAQSAAGPRARTSRGDAWGNLGWFNGNKSDVAAPYNRWYNHSLWGAAGASYYWTDHWKTEVEIGAHTEALVRGQRQAVATVPPDLGYFPYIYAEHRYMDRTVSVGQSYQFFRNAWVHPFIGGGVDLDWERHSFSTPRQTVFTRPPDSRGILLTTASTGREDRFRPKAFVSGGLKAYFSERGFFRTDLKLTGADRIDHVVWRFGFGVDW